VIARETGLIFAVPLTHAPVFGSVPDVIGGAVGLGWFVESVNWIEPPQITFPDESRI
jgi:hypothetical protein